MWFVLEATIFVGSRDQNDRLPDAISQKFCDSQPLKAILFFPNQKYTCYSKSFKHCKKRREGIMVNLNSNVKSVWVLNRFVLLLEAAVNSKPSASRFVCLYVFLYLI